MARFELRLETDNAAFGETAAERDSEVARILQQIATRIGTGESSGSIRDVNGNRVGSYGPERDERDEQP